MADETPTPPPAVVPPDSPAIVAPPVTRLIPYTAGIDSVSVQMQGENLGIEIRLADGGAVTFQHMAGGHDHFSIENDQHLTPAERWQRLKTFSDDLAKFSQSIAAMVSRSTRKV